MAWSPGRSEQLRPSSKHSHRPREAPVGERSSGEANPIKLLLIIILYYYYYIIIIREEQRRSESDQASNGLAAGWSKRLAVGSAIGSGLREGVAAAQREMYYYY